MVADRMRTANVNLWYRTQRSPRVSSIILKVYIERHVMNLSSDQFTRVAQLRDVVRQFVAERDWQPFHSPKNLSMALAIEAAELMEHYQWVSIEESRAFTRNPERRAAVAEELADVVCYALALANELDLDLTSTVVQKMEKNARKYPVDQFRGRYGRSDPGPATPPTDGVAKE